MYPFGHPQPLGRVPPGAVDDEQVPFSLAHSYLDLRRRVSLLVVALAVFASIHSATLPEFHIRASSGRFLSASASCQRWSELSSALSLGPAFGACSLTQWPPHHLAGGLALAD
jgi:hypothetical protein